MKNKGATERIMLICNEIYNGKKSQMARDVGITPSTLSSIVGSRRSSPSVEVLEKVATALKDKVDFNWVMTGIGGMTLQNNYKKPKSNIVEEDVASYTGDSYMPKGCPYYNIDFAGGFGEFLDNPSVLPESYISMQPYDSMGCLWCNLSGRSMEPAIMSGDRIVMRPIRISNVIYGKIYAIVTRSGMRTVKHIVRSSDASKIRLVPENKDPMFGDYQDVDITDILQIFEVLASVRMFQ